jgi:hypothetical protein
MLYATVSSFASSGSISFKDMDAITGSNAQIYHGVFIVGYASQLYINYVGTADTINYITPTVPTYSKN